MSAEIVLGGPDPFPEEEDGDCWASEGGYLCTRNAGHEPPHVAVGDVYGVIAVWPPYRELELLAPVPSLGERDELDCFGTDRRPCEARSDLVPGMAAAFACTRPRGHAEKEHVASALTFRPDAPAVAVAVWTDGSAPQIIPPDLAARVLR